MLDIPYLLMFGVIPPVHVMNEILRSGGWDGGMGPGTSWPPFEISQTEYDELKVSLLKMELQDLRNNNEIRFVPEKIIEDIGLEDLQTHHEWLVRAREKYGDNG